MSAVAAADDLPRGFREDGPPARALARLLGPRIPLPGPALALVGALPLLAVAAVGGADVSLPVVAAVLAWAVVAESAAGARPDRKGVWIEPPLVRLTEYVAYVWLAALEGSHALPSAFALIAALAFHNYDMAYRLRHQGAMPPAWLSMPGWEGRVAIAFVLLAAGALPAGFYVAAGVLGVVFVVEATRSWIVAGRGAEADPHADEQEVDEP
jgi:Family of unknown function (DUF5941)